MSKQALWNPDDFIASFRTEFDKQPMDTAVMWSLGVQQSESSAAGTAGTMPRTMILIASGKGQMLWEAPPLRSLFRGNAQPPVLGNTPTAYQDIFMIIESQFATFCEYFGDPRDAEMEEIYARLRKRPDGNSLGLMHDYMWKTMAVVLATHSLSQAEYEAIVGRLERSCRTFGMGSTSRNYALNMRQMFP